MDVENKKPEVLMVSTDMNGKGGVASVVSTYVNGGLLKNYNIKFLVTHIEGSNINKIFNFICSLFTLSKFLISRKCRIFHLHTASRSSFLRKSLISWLGIAFGKKIMLHLHGGEFMQFYNDECGSLMKWYIRSTLNAANQVVVLSSQWKRNIKSIADKANITIIFNPVIVHNNRVDFTDKNILLFLGKIGEGKGFWDILNALSLIKETHRNFILKYAGDGEVEKAKLLINDLGLESYTEYIGWISGDKKQQILNQALIYLLPSYNEGLPMGILEAMASKVSVITSPVGGIPDVIDSGVNGLLVKPGDINALSQAIIKLLDSESLRVSLTNNAYQGVKLKFSVDVVIPQIEALYYKLGAR